MIVRLLLDEMYRPTLADALRDKGHDVVSGHGQPGGRREHADERLAERTLVLVRIQPHAHHLDLLVVN